jgi:hypothetical protein
MTQTTFTSGELSPKMEGRFDLAQYANGCRTIENMIVLPQGPAETRPGTYFVAEVKDSTKKVRMVPFEFSTVQTYVLEFGHEYIRIYKDQGQVVYETLTIDVAPAPADWEADDTITGATSGFTSVVVSKTSSTEYIIKGRTGDYTDGEILSDGTNSRDCGAGYPIVANSDTPAEIVSPYQEDELFDLQYVQSADIMYIVHPNHAPRKLTRTAHDVWTITTPTFTVSGTEAFDAADHYPSCLAFHEERLLFSGLIALPDTLFGSVVGAWENFTQGTDADDAFEYTVASSKVNLFRWLSSHNVLLLGSRGSEWKGADLSPNTAPSLNRQSTYGSMNLNAVVLNDRVLYVQRRGRNVRELYFNYDTDTYVSPDLTLLADHITEGGIVSWDYQQEPYSILWAVRGDGVLLAMTYASEQQVLAWSRIITDGEIESVAVISGTGEDEIWISVKRTIEEVDYRYIEYFKPRDWGTDQSDCFFVDSGLTFDGGAAKTITGATVAEPVVITSAAHGFANDYLVKITSVSGMTELNDNVYIVKNVAENTFELYQLNGTDPIDGTAFTEYTEGGSVQRVTETLTGLDHLEGETVAILTDGANHTTKVVASGSITLDVYANKVHAGLPYTSQLMPMKIGEPGKIKKVVSVVVRFYKSLSCKVGPDVLNLESVFFRGVAPVMGSPPEPYTGDKEVMFRGEYQTEGDILIVNDQPLPMTILALVPEVS